MKGTMRSVILLAVAVAVTRAASAQSLSPGSNSPYLGGVPSGPPASGSISLSIADAIARALDHNLGAVTAEQDAGHADGARTVALSQLLPNVNGRFAGIRQEINLAAFGFPLPAGLPSVVGPFNVVDARIYLSQAILDLSALNQVRQERHKVAAAAYSYKSARDLVVLVTANVYLQSLAAAARVESAQAQLQTAMAIGDQARNLKSAGLVAGIDVLRADVQLSTARQRATAAANDFEKSKLQLAHVVGLPIGQVFTLSDQLPSLPAGDVSLEDALDRAYKTRPDYMAALEKVRAAESARQAALDESLPSLRVNADYGAIGQTFPSLQSTFTVVGALNVPIFQGNRTHGRLLEADADLRTRRAEAENLRATIYYDVRTALLDVKASGEQLDVAGLGRDLAGQQLTQARDRFAAGIATNIEVVQAQEAVALASEQYIAAQYSFNVAKAVLDHGLGIAEEAAKQYLGGIR